MKGTKPIFKRVWFWIVIVIVVIGVSSVGSKSKNLDNGSSNSGTANESAYSVDSETGTESSAASNEAVSDTNKSTKAVSTSNDEEVSRDFRNAYKKAELYYETMHMSKAGIYDQLTSEYGEGFDADAAQYAVDKLDATADWNDAALKKAEVYSETMSMSTSAIYDQLISEYGEKFTPEQAQYAIDHLS